MAGLLAAASREGATGTCQMGYETRLITVPIRYVNSYVLNSTARAGYFFSNKLHSHGTEESTGPEYYYPLFCREESWQEGTTVTHFAIRQSV